jgi:hypothetical protein
MHLLCHRRRNQFLCLFISLIIPIASVPIAKQDAVAILCSLPNKNCTFPKHSTNSPAPYPSAINALITKVSTIRPTPTQRVPSVATGNARSTSPSWFTTSRPRVSTSTSSYYDFDSFTENIKRAAIILAAVAVGLGILRVCLMFCKSSSNDSNRSSNTVSPRNDGVQPTIFKPDLPPAYAEAILRGENRSGKLPKYDDLPNEQQQQPYLVHS